jgi:hypothetical protein
MAFPLVPFFALKRLIALSPEWSEAEPGERIRKTWVALQGERLRVSMPQLSRQITRVTQIQDPSLRPLRSSVNVFFCERQTANESAQKAAKITKADQQAVNCLYSFFRVG